jgi:magnesium transporter
MDPRVPTQKLLDDAQTTRPIDSQRTRILIDSIQRLLRRDAAGHLRRIVDKTHGADLAVVFRALADDHRLAVYRLIDDMEKRGELLYELDAANLQDLIAALAEEDVAVVLKAMPSDDAARIIARLPDELGEALLQRIRHDGSDAVMDLLNYGNETAGGIMTPDIVCLRQETEARACMSALQEEFADTEMPFYLYAVDEHGKLVGVSSLRQLVVHPPETPLKAFMDTNVVSVSTDTDQEEVARIVARYNFLGVPVVDGSNHPVGIVTVDDVIDILRIEATEDILKMAGVGEAYVETQTVWISTKRRLPWLFASCMGGIFAFMVIGRFENSLGGNVGTQSSTIVVRGLATGFIQLPNLLKVVTKELSIGLILGLVYGLLIGAVATLAYSRIELAVAVGSAVLCSMAVAAFIGSLVPLALARANIDPAVATGPFVTTAIDVISVYFYFWLATLLLGL